MSLIRSGSFVGVALLAAGSVLVGTVAPAAGPDAEFGHRCVANHAAPGATLVLSAGDAAHPIPGVSPRGGVITSVRFGINPSGSVVVPTVVKVMRSQGGDDYLTLRQTGELPVSGDQKRFETRLPVRSGDALGLYGSGSTLYCTLEAEGDTVGQVAGNTTVGATDTFVMTSTWALPIVATVEPDADRDDYGDLTQDLCPQSAARQTACPRIRITGSAVAKKGRTLTRLSTSENARVTVRGTVKVTGKKFTFRSAKQVKQSRSKKFTLTYPRAMRQGLATVPPRKTFTLAIAATTKNAAGRTSKKKLKVKIPGTR